GQLNEEEYRRPRDGSFGSIHGLLNHILLGDRIWLARFTGTGAAVTPPLDRELYSDFAGLRAAKTRRRLAAGGFSFERGRGFSGEGTTVRQQPGGTPYRPRRTAAGAPLQSPDAPSRPGARNAQPGWGSPAGARHAPRDPSGG